MTDSNRKKISEVLEKMLPGTNGLERIRILTDLSKSLRDINPRKAVEFGEQGLELLRDADDSELESAILNELCWANQCLGEYQAALGYGFRKLEIADEINDDKDRSSALNIIGVTYWRLAKFDQALECFLKALNISENSRDNESIPAILNNIGLVYESINDINRALEYHNRAIRITEELDNKHSLAVALNNAGNIYRVIGQYEKALEYHRRALEIKEKLREKWRISSSLINIGSVLMELKEYDKSLESFFRALEIEEETGDRHEAAETLIRIGKIYAIVDRFLEACEYVERGLLLAEELGVPDLKRDCFQAFSTILEKKGDFGKALEYHKKYKTLNDEIFTEENINKISELQVQYETEKKDKEKEIYRLRNIELVKANEALVIALAEVKQLSGLLPICASCKKIRDDRGYWKQIESYISDHSEAQFSHGLCPECIKKLYPEYITGKDEALSLK